MLGDEGPRNLLGEVARKRRFEKVARESFDKETSGSSTAALMKKANGYLLSLQLLGDKQKNHSEVSQVIQMKLAGQSRQTPGQTAAVG